jgi:predicted DNA-binding transcriptional regulator AlpA
MESSDRLVPLQEVMHMLGLGRTTIYKLVELSKLPKPIKTGGGKSAKILWPESEINAFIEKLKKERDMELA